MSPPGVGVNARQGRDEQDDEERGNAAMPVVIPISGNDLEEDGVFPVQIRRLVMEEGNDLIRMGKGKQLRAFRPQEDSCPHVMACIGGLAISASIFPSWGQRHSYIG